MIKPGFTTSIYSWQKSFSVFLTTQKFCTGIFSGCFVLNGEHFQHPQCANFSVAKLLMTAITIGFSFPVCSAQFLCHDRVVIRINLVFVLHCCCCSSSVAARPVTNDPFKVHTTTDPVSEPTSTAFSPYTLSQTPMNLYWTGVIHNKKFSHHSQPHTYAHNIHHFALLLCWTRVTDWSTNYPCGGDSVTIWCARQETLSGATFKRRGGKKKVITFVLTLTHTHTHTHTHRNS